MHRLSARLLLITLFLALFACDGRADADTTIPRAADLAATGDEARSKGLPVMLVFTTDDCPYCQMVKDEFIRPMIKSGDYADRVMFRLVRLSGWSAITDFDGADIDPDDLGERYQVRVTPTIALVGPDGERLADNLVGITTPDFYGSYLDDRIETARAALATR